MTESRRREIWVSCPACNSDVAVRPVRNRVGLIALEFINHKRCPVKHGPTVINPTIKFVRLSSLAPVIGYSALGARKLLARNDLPIWRWPGEKFLLTVSDFETAILRAKKCHSDFFDIIEKLPVMRYNGTERSFTRWTYSEILILLRNPIDRAIELLPERTAEAVRQKIRRLL